MDLVHGLLEQAARRNILQGKDRHCFQGLSIDMNLDLAHLLILLDRRNQRLIDARFELDLVFAVTRKQQAGFRRAQFQFLRGALPGTYFCNRLLRAEQRHGVKEAKPPVHQLKAGLRAVTLAGGAHHCGDQAPVITLDR